MISARSKCGNAADEKISTKGHVMVWTKLKKIAESLLADTLKGRIKYHTTRYGNGVSYFMSRGWITLDREEIVNCSTIKHHRESTEDSSRSYSAYEEAKPYLDKQSIFTRDDFVNGLEEYVSLQVEDALKSLNPIVRAVAMFDRRLGKRRLSDLSLPDDEHELVKNFYNIRCRVEGLQSEE